MNEIYIIIEKVGDVETIVDKAYWYYGAAESRASVLLQNSRDKGYTDFKYIVKPLEIEGLK